MKRYLVLIFLLTLFLVPSLKPVQAITTFYTASYWCNSFTLGNPTLTPMTPFYPSGVGECAGGLYRCRDGETGGLNSNFGNKVSIFTPHTGDTIFCSASGTPTPVGCGYFYTINNSALERGNYCENEKLGLSNGEADIKCVEYNYREDRGFSAIVDAFRLSRPVDITEDNIEDWFYNDPFDPDGNRTSIKSLISEVQVSKLNIKTSSYGKATENQLLQVKKDYLDQGDPVPLIFALNSGGGHAVILTDISYDTLNVSYTLSILDSNAGGKASMQCGVSEGSLLCQVLKANGEFWDLVRIIDIDYGLSIVDSLRTAKQNYCAQDPVPKGDLCYRNVKSWMIDKAALFGSNFGSASSLGNCFGWAITLLKSAYLANFTGEMPISPGIGCVSDVMGENNTAQCRDNQVACLVLVDVPRPLLGRVNDFSQCAYQYKATPVNPLLAFLNGVTEIICDGQERSIPLPKVYGFDPGLTVIYQAFRRSTDMSFLDGLNDESSNLATQEDHSQLAMAVIMPPPKLSKFSCSSSIMLGSNKLTYTYQKGYVFSHPDRQGTAAEHYAIDFSNLSKSLKNFYHLLISDVVFVPGESETAWSWRPGDAEPIMVPIDSYTAGYLSLIRKWQTDRRIDDSCQLASPLPSRFTDLLNIFNPSAATPTLVFTAIPATITPTASVTIRWTSTNLAATAPVKLEIMQNGQVVKLVSSFANSGLYTFSWPQIPQGVYQLRLSSGLTSAISGNITVMAITPAQSLAFIAPTGPVTAGVKISVAWTSAGYVSTDTGQLYLYRADGTKGGTMVVNPYQLSVMTGVSQDSWKVSLSSVIVGNFRLALRVDLAPGSYRFVLVSNTGNGAVYRSVVFTVVAAATPEVLGASTVETPTQKPIKIYIIAGGLALLLIGFLAVKQIKKF